MTNSVPNVVYTFHCPGSGCGMRLCYLAADPFSFEEPLKPRLEVCPFCIRIFSFHPCRLPALATNEQIAEVLADEVLGKKLNQAGIARLEGRRAFVAKLGMN